MTHAFTRTGAALFCIFALSPNARAAHLPDPHLTPGVLCTDDDPDFMDNYYDEGIARCKRNVGTAEKTKVANLYGGIPHSEWSKYEFDHFIPLCAGGSNDIKNIWPQPLTESHEKDLVEDEVCRGMQSGDLTQKEAVKKVLDWYDEQAAHGGH